MTNNLFMRYGLWCLLASAAVASGCAPKVEGTSVSDLSEFTDPSHQNALSDDGCDDCHGDEYDGAHFAHASVNYGRACTECHGERDWTPIVDIDHSQYSPVVGIHARFTCGTCHTSELSMADGGCVECHVSDRARAELDHTGFSNACGTCHAQTAWRPAIITHDFWPIDGAHTRLDCGDCHKNEVFAGTPRECVGCHLEDKVQAIDPGHGGLASTCEDCHTTTAWTPAVFDHADFPIPHEGHGDCQSCHENSDDYLVFTCTSCHEHSRERMDAEHRRVRPYQYNDAACYRCHPRGR